MPFVRECEGEIFPAMFFHAGPSLLVVFFLRGFSRGFAARVFGLRPGRRRVGLWRIDEAPHRTREKTSGTQGSLEYAKQESLKGDF